MLDHNNPLPHIATALTHLSVDATTLSNLIKNDNLIHLPRRTLDTRIAHELHLIV